LNRYVASFRKHTAFSGPFVLKRSLSFTFSYPVYLGPGQTTKTFDDAVLNNATAYAYEAFRRTLTDTLHFYHADHLGTPIAMTNGTGALVWRAEHTPFGGIFALTVGTTANNLRFPGQYYDGETGLSQNWHRDYSHFLGRYYQGEPLPKSVSRCKTLLLWENYPYASLNPLSSYDFNGRFTLVGFPRAEVLPALTESVNNAINGLRKCCDCPICKDAADKLSAASIFYTRELGSICGATWPYINPNGFYVGPGVLPGKHCCAAQTFAEEALHLAGASDSNNEAGQYAARCVPCR